jgi:hypothetical protein
MTIEKMKRTMFASPLCYGRKTNRREARKLYREEQRYTRDLIRKGKLTRRTRWEQGQVIRCPKYMEEIMDIWFTRRVWNATWRPE